ncbi:CapA family protein [Paracoccus benzoatiresistens]|uniref:CapA family protein n=1 Tax=Paracoccus benzoatiresistens TaxID=2997341 RepID=A0ABT4J0M9_9RHOB|nr:CapA family protein [Paracoccus sp. EF6]MCZ0960675.1 CapA family protein [Paracoccus sp. EF6]
MQIDQSSFILPGNVYSRGAIFRATSAEAAEKVIDPQAIRRLRRALAFMRPAILDFPGGRRLRRSETAWPAAAVAEVMAVIAQRYVAWPVSFSAYRPADAGRAAEGEGTADGETAAQTERPADSERAAEGESAAEGTGAADGEENAPTSRQAQGTAIFETTNAQIGLAAAQAGFAVAQALVDGVQGPQLRSAVRNALRGYLKATLPVTPGADGLLLAKMAGQRGLPWHVVTGSKYIRVGLGPQARFLKGTESTTTSSIGVKLAGDKSMANRLLAEAGLPVAKQRTARTEEEAVAAAGELGYPLVIKPFDGNMGRDVTLAISNEDEVRAAFARAVRRSEKAVIETMIMGDEMRLLVGNGKLLSVTVRRPAQVIGDGTRTVAQLVREENRRPERDTLLKGSYALMKLIQLDEDALALLTKQGLTPDSVPEEGRQVFLRLESNVSRGGSSLDVTDQIHPSIIRAAEAASRVLHIDVCGVDFVTTDLSRPWQETGGAICEINSRPGLHMQVLTAPEERRESIVSGAFDALLGEAASQSLPVVALVGPIEATRGLRQTLETLAQRAGRKLGIVGEAGRLAPSSQPLKTVADLFQANDIDAAVILVKPRDLLEQGLGLPRIAAALMPPDLGARTGGVRRLLNRVANRAVVTADDPAALERLATALNLPTDSLASTWPAAREPLSAEDDGRNKNAGAYTVLFAGDVGFGESYLKSPRMAGLREVLSSQGHGHSISNLVGLLQSADHVIGNLEVPLAESPDPALAGRKNYLGWSDADRTVAALREAGFDALSLANNHALDCGAAGLAETIRRLDDAGIRHFGAGASRDDAQRPYLHSFSAGGSPRTLVVFGGFEYRTRYQQQYRWYASRAVAGVGVISPRWIGEWIKANGSGLTNPTFVAFPHWGTDYEGITKTQRDTASELIDQGIDLIIGHGAHVAQPVEIVGGKTVVFNLGNFIWNTPGRFDRFKAPPYGVAAALRFNEDAGSVPTLNLYPLMIDNEVTNFQSRPVTGLEVEPSLEVLTQALPSRPPAANDSIGHHLRLAI